MQIIKTEIMVKAVVQAAAIVIFHCVRWGETITVQKRC